MKFAGHMLKILTALFIILSLAPLPAYAADPAKLLTGTWKVKVPARDRTGNPSPLIPDQIEFFPDHTVIMSNMPGNRVPYKTELTSDEQKAMVARDPKLKGKKLLLIRTEPQTEWTATPIVYGYTVSKNILSLTVTGWKPAKLTRIP